MQIIRDSVLRFSGSAILLAMFAMKYCPQIRRVLCFFQPREAIHSYRNLLTGLSLIYIGPRAQSLFKVYYSQRAREFFFPFIPACQICSMVFWSYSNCDITRFTNIFISGSCMRKLYPKVRDMYFIFSSNTLQSWMLCLVHYIEICY